MHPCDLSESGMLVAFNSSSLHNEAFAVVQVFCTHSEPNYSLPWQRKRQYTSTSSGFVIDGSRILTNAHSVDHHTQVTLNLSTGLHLLKVQGNVAITS